MSWEANRRFRVAKIGDPDSYLSPGMHVFVINYRVDGVLAPARGGTSGTDARFLWRVVPDGRRMPITRSETRIELPGKPLAAACRVDDGAPCTITESGPRSRIVTTGALPPMTGVAFRADLPSAAPDRTATPWSQYLDAVLGRSLRTVTALVLASLVMLGAGVAWVLRSRESTPPQPVMVVPPADPQRPDSALGPVQTYFATHGEMPRRALAATLLYLADRRLVRLDRDGDTWTITSLVGADGWERVDEVSRSVGPELGLSAGSRAHLCPTVHSRRGRSCDRPATSCPRRPCRGRGAWAPSPATAPSGSDARWSSPS